MNVTKEKLEEVLETISKESVVSLDVESTGLRPFHGDRLFAISIAFSNHRFYLNFKPYDGLDPSLVLDPHLIPQIFDRLPATLIGHNIKFDMHMLHQSGVTRTALLTKSYWDTMVVQRLVRNDSFDLSLDACVKELGEEKSTAVEEYISKYKLFESVCIPGKKTRKPIKHFHKVPFEIMSEYAKKDAELAFKLYLHQESVLKGWDESSHKKIAPLLENEMQLLKVCFDMELTGIRLDYDHVVRAIEIEKNKIESITKEIEGIIGKPFKDSNKFLSELFSDYKVRLTEKGNPSFTGDNLSVIDNPLARLIERLRDHSKRKNTYFESFKYENTREDIIHPNLNQAAAQTGRFSVKNPALQTLNKEESSDSISVRASFIPRPGNVLVEMDYKSMEFVLMCDYAEEMELIEKLKQGLDPHLATAELVGLERREAKTISFMLLYGGGVTKLSESLGISLKAAREIKAKYFQALPRVEALISGVMERAKVRGYIFNFMGRRSYFLNPAFAYKAPNALIQGSGADVCKIAMVRLHEFLAPYQTKMVLQIHDAILFDMPPNEIWLIPYLKKIMEEAYPYKHIPLQVSVEHSWDSWGDLLKGEPIVRETRESVQAPSQEVFTGA